MLVKRKSPAQSEIKWFGRRRWFWIILILLLGLLLISNGKVDQKGVAPKTPYFARGRRNVTMVYNKTRLA